VDRLCQLVIVYVTWQGDVIQIVQPRAVEATDYIHYVVENHRFMKSSFFRRNAYRFNFRPLACLGFVAEQIFEPLLLSINTSKDEDGSLVCDC
jgi:hypothetical protein